MIEDRDKQAIMQRYIKRPLLLNDRKSEIRIYWLLASINPLRVLMFNEGTVRLNTLPYQLDQFDNPLIHANTDVNVASWNRLVSNLLATGGDDGWPAASLSLYCCWYWYCWYSCYHRLHRPPRLQHRTSRPQSQSRPRRRQS